MAALSKIIYLAQAFKPLVPPAPRRGTDCGLASATI
jgi:hypothetical protein